MKFRIKTTFVLLLFIIICIINLESVTSGMQKALVFCARTVIPSLFIFMVLSDVTVTLALSSGLPAFFSPKAVILCIGALCGFPIGAVVCEKFYKQKIINANEVSKILPLCNIASPAFVIGAVGSSMYGDKKIGFLLYFSLFVSSFFRFITIKCKHQLISSNSTVNIDTFFTAIEKSIYGLLRVCALICFFTAVLSLIEHTKLNYLAFLLEVSCGCSLASSFFATHPYFSIGMCGFCLGFSGFCVHAQIVSVAKSININYAKFFFSKFFQGISCAVISILGYYLFFVLEIL